VHNIGEKLAESEALGEAGHQRWLEVEKRKVLSWPRNEAIEQLLRMSKWENSK